LLGKHLRGLLLDSSLVFKRPALLLSLVFKRLALLLEHRKEKLLGG
jgi:hypothetical protein